MTHESTDERRTRQPAVGRFRAARAAMAEDAAAERAQTVARIAGAVTERIIAAQRLMAGLRDARVERAAAQRQDLEAFHAELLEAGRTLRADLVGARCDAAAALREELAAFHAELTEASQTLRADLAGARAEAAAALRARLSAFHADLVEAGEALRAGYSGARAEMAAALRERLVELRRALRAEVEQIVSSDFPGAETSAVEAFDEEEADNAPA